MKGITARFVRLGAGLLALVTVAWILTGQAAKPEAEHGYPTDWSHRHLIFSHPATAEQEARLNADPRYWQQFVRRNFPRVVSDDGRDVADFSFANFLARHKPQPPSQPVHGDWSQSLGNGGSVGAGNFPAKYSFQISTANCGNAAIPDYVVFNTGLQGTTTQASVIAFTNLYSGCTVGTVPTVYWSYNTGGIVLTSPVISGDGTQVAFVQSDSSLHGALVVLKFAASGGTVATPTTLVPVPSSSYFGCTAPCMTTVPLHDNASNPVDDRTSWAFPDYAHDVLWVGGASGWLHKITGAFRSNPAEVTTGGFPAHLNGGASALGSPVYDFASNNLFVADLGGFLYQVNPSNGTFTASGRVDSGVGLVSAPIVNSTTSKVYVFSSNDGSVGCGGGPCSAVFQFSYGFPAGSTGTKAIVGASSATPKPMYEGDFDNAYFASGIGTGNMYVCGNTGGTPTLYQIPITAGAMGTVVKGPTLTGAATGCSPVTDFSNPNVTGNPDEWIFAGVQNSGLGNLCATGGCMMNFNVQPWKPNTSYLLGQQVLDTHFQIQTVRTAGTSGAAAPAWSLTPGNTTTQGAMRWVDQGPQNPSHPGWTPATAYNVLGFAIIDNNGNVQVVITRGTSKTGAHPTWNAAINGRTFDNTVTWRNVGLPATASFSAAGGTSAIVVDNTVPTSTLAGASQIYFSTQSNQTCGSSGTGGCAVQASQAALN